MVTLMKKENVREENETKEKTTKREILIDKGTGRKEKRQKETM